MSGALISFVTSMTMLRFCISAVIGDNLYQTLSVNYFTNNKNMLYATGLQKKLCSAIFLLWCSVGYSETPNSYPAGDHSFLWGR